MDLISMKKDATTLILTGISMPEQVRLKADCIYHISTEKEMAPPILGDHVF